MLCGASSDRKTPSLPDTSSMSMTSRKPTGPVDNDGDSAPMAPQAQSLDGVVRSTHSRSSSPNRASSLIRNVSTPPAPEPRRLTVGAEPVGRSYLKGASSRYFF